MTMRPPRSRSRSWRAISSAASQFVLNAVVSMSRALGRARRVDVDGDQRLGVVDHDGAARRQRHLPRVRGLDLVLDLEAREQRDVVLVELHAVHVGRHHVAHELLRLLVDRFRVDQQLADVRVEVVADRADDEARLLVDQVRARLHLRGVLDGVPQLHQVVQVPLQLFGRAADAGGARDDAHALRHVEAVDRVAQLVALLAFDAARHAAAARVVRHQDEVASRERDVRGQRGALVAALVLVDLDDQLLAFLELVLDPRLAGVGVAVAEVVARDFLERQETVAVGAVVDEAGFERGLDARDDGLVDVALALFLGGGFDVEVDELLTIDDRHPEFLRLGGIEQHAFHVRSPAQHAAGRRRRSKTRRELRGGKALEGGGRGRRHRHRRWMAPAGGSGARGHVSGRHSVRTPTEAGRVGSRRAAWSSWCEQAVEATGCRSGASGSLAPRGGGRVLKISLMAPRNAPLRTGRCRVRRLR